MKKMGKFIVVDGIDGGGKSTLIAAAVKASGGRINLSNLADSVLGKVHVSFLHDVRTVADSAMLFSLAWAGFRERLLNSIIPTLASGITVIADRFDSSIFAYQIIAQQAPHLKKLFFEMREVLLREQEPDLYVFLDVDPRVGLGRKKFGVGGLNLFERQTVSFHERVRKGFHEFSKHMPHAIIDANQAVEKVRAWRDRQNGPLKSRPGPKGDLLCPTCQGPLGAVIHSSLTQVVLDRCSDPACGGLWCDGGELEAIQMLVEDARKGGT